MISDEKTKKDLIHKAKMKKQYAKVKAEAEEEKQSKREEREAALAHNDEQEADEDRAEVEDKIDNEESEAVHPTRQLMLKDEEAAQTGATADQSNPDGQRRRTRRPGYYDKQLEKADEKRQESEARAAEWQRRREERDQKIAERDRYKKAMKKTWGKDGKKKLGRESGLLLERVRKMVDNK